MIAEAIDTVLTLGWALAVWIVLVSLTAALALHTVLVAVWWAGRAVWRAWRWLYGRLRTVEGRDGDPEPLAHPRPAQSRSRRPVPSWAHTQPLDHQEAA